MPSRKISRREMLSACAEVGADDGQDPRRDQPMSGAKRSSRKALQLCAQVARALADVFADCGDDVLRNLHVESVTPAPNTARLLVTVAPALPMETSQILERLDRARARLRTEAVAAIHRRRAPDFLFRVREVAP